MSVHLFEFKRQLAHIVFGLLILWGIHFDFFNALVLGILIVVLFPMLFAIKKGCNIPIFCRILSFFEREDHMKHSPGRGLISFMLGAWFCVYFFPKDIVMASLSILLVGDAITNIVGRHFGKLAHFFNKDKTLEGTLAGILASFAVCMLFFPPLPSFITATLAMIAEIPKISFGKIVVDDNFTIPFVSSLTLYTFSLFI